MDDATLVTRSKIRLARSKSLKDWTMKAVLSNMDAYTQEEGANYLKTKLSPELTDYVLQELLRTRRPGETTTIKEFNRMKQSVFVLLNTRTKKLDLDVLMSFYPSDLNSELDFIEVLRMVSIAAPNVRHLKINTYQMTICLDSAEYRNTSLGFLNSLKELRILEFVGFVNDPMDLLLCCRNLPNLQVLSAPGADLEHTNISEKDIRLSFGNLRVLHVPNMLSKILKRIWKVLPNLDILGERTLPNGLTLEDFLGDENTPGARKYLNHSLISGSNACSDLSSIKYLEFHCFDRRWTDFERNLKLPTPIDGLNLLFMWNSREIVEAVLLKYGANLRWLSLNGCAYEIIDLNRISELCPKLEALSMTSVEVNRSSTQEIKFCHLKELDIKEGKMVNESLTALLSSCPNLRKLKLKVLTCCLEDLQQVKNLIVEKKIMGSVQSIHWGIPCPVDGHVFKEISNILKNASANLSELRKMKLSVEKRDSLLWKLMSTDTFLRHTIDMHDVFLFEFLKLY